MSERGSGLGRSVVDAGGRPGRAPADLREASETAPLWYRRPARKWTEALPIGNGRLGGMVFGRLRASAAVKVTCDGKRVESGRPEPNAAVFVAEAGRTYQVRGAP